MTDGIHSIFVVDDEHTIASTLAAILRMSGFTAWFFTSPGDALAAPRWYRPDLLISDVAMPGMSGVDLAISMSEQFPETKILLFSGQAATGDLLEAARRRGHDFQLLGKPLHPAVLTSRTKALPHRQAGVLHERSHEELSQWTVTAGSRAAIRASLRDCGCHVCFQGRKDIPQGLKPIYCQ